MSQVECGPLVLTHWIKHIHNTFSYHNVFSALNFLNSLMAVIYEKENRTSLIHCAKTMFPINKWNSKLSNNTISDFAETDPNCKRFLDRVFPEVYKKVKFWSEYLYVYI